MLQDLYAASKENQTFLHARFGLGQDPLMPYKQVIARSLWPDWNKPSSVTAAKKAMSAFGKANGRAEDVTELMIFFCEQAAGFVQGVGLEDETYFDALVRMYSRALAAVAALQNPERAKNIERLNRVRELCRDIGYGVFDEMTMLFEESGFGNARQNLNPRPLGS